MAGPNPVNADSLEVEWQFEAPDLAQVARWLRAQPAHAALTFVDRGERVQVDRYLDTDDWRIYRSGYALRVRSSDRGAEATLKSFGTATRGTARPARRREINEALPTPDSDPLTAPGGVGERLRLLCASRPLRALFEVTTRRRGFHVTRQGAEIAAVALDVARIGDDVPGAPVLQRVEIEESVPDGLATIESFMDALRAACRLRPATASKFASGLRAAGLTPAPDFDLGPRDADPDGPVSEFALAAFRRAFSAFLDHEPGTRLGEDVRPLHQMRVATRRMRAIGNVFAPVLTTEIAALREELRWVARALGAVRDLDVQLEELAALRRGADWDEGTALGPLVEIVRAERDERRGELLAALDSVRYDRLVNRLTELLRGGVAVVATGAAAGAGTAGEPVTVYAAPVLRRRFRRFRVAAEQLRPDSPAPDYHAVRVRAKRFRYALEQFADAYGRNAARAARRVKVAQDLLGEHQDSDVAIDWLRRLSRERGAELASETLLAIGQLMERHRARMERLRGDWPRVFRQLRRSWARLRRTARAAARDAEAAAAGESAAEPASEVPPSDAPHADARSLAGRPTPASGLSADAHTLAGEAVAGADIPGRAYARLRSGVERLRIRARRGKGSTH